jgi:hypothetical protein
MLQSPRASVHKKYDDDLFLYKVSSVLREMKYSNYGM